MATGIRVFKAGDIKIARYLIGTALMTPLAVANRRALMHPITVAIWLALASVMIQLFGWWPTTTGTGGKLGLLLPLPALAVIAVPIMVLLDWFHRPIFEDETHKSLTAEDMKNPLEHYTRSAASGFYLLDYDNKPIGLIALDASPESPDHAPGRKAKTKTQPSADIAIIRHFHVEEMYRPSGVQSDLLEYAVSRAFAAVSRPRKVMAMARTLDNYKVDVLRASGFRPTTDVKNHGPRVWKPVIYRWTDQWFEVTSEEWLAKHIVPYTNGLRELVRNG